jgi:hypothetical protein
VKKNQEKHKITRKNNDARNNGLWIFGTRINGRARKWLNAQVSAQLTDPEGVRIYGLPSTLRDFV